MALEIERRFLVKQEFLPEPEKRNTIRITQGYLSRPADSMALRVRQSQRGYGPLEMNLTIKRKIQDGINKEFEIQVFSGASELMEECGDKILEKVRYEFPIGGLKFEVDFFAGKLDGIVIAEVELPSLDHKFKFPKFLGKEITEVKGLSNFNMVFERDKALEIFKGL